jgi:hypothetical protein
MLSYPLPIPDNAIDLSPGPPEFAQSFSDIVGNAGTSTDGFETIFQILMDHPADTINFLTGYDSDLVDVGAAVVDLGTAWEGDYSAALSNTISQGQGDFDAYAVDLTGNTPPPPGPSPQPTGAQNCLVKDFGNVPVGKVEQITVTITNNSDHNILIHDIVVTGINGPNVFAINRHYQGQGLSPGQSVPLIVAADASTATPAAYSSLITIQTDQPDPQPCIVAKVNVTPGTPAPGGGGGGGGTGGGGGGGGGGRIHLQ